MWSFQFVDLSLLKAIEEQNLNAFVWSNFGRFLKIWIWCSLQNVSVTGIKCLSEIDNITIGLSNKVLVINGIASVRKVNCVWKKTNHTIFIFIFYPNTINSSSSYLYNLI